MTNKQQEETNELLRQLLTEMKASNQVKKKEAREDRAKSKISLGGRFMRNIKGGSRMMSTMSMMGKAGPYGAAAEAGGKASMLVANVIGAQMEQRRGVRRSASGFETDASVNARAHQKDDIVGLDSLGDQIPLIGFLFKEMAADMERARNKMNAAFEFEQNIVQNKAGGALQSLAEVGVNVSDDTIANVGNAVRSRAKNMADTQARFMKYQGKYAEQNYIKQPGFFATTQRH